MDPTKSIVPNTWLSDFLHDALRLDLPNLHPGDAEGGGNLVPGSSGNLTTVVLYTDAYFLRLLPPF